jgi:hypothetical protein
MRFDAPWLREEVSPFTSRGDLSVMWSIKPVHGLEDSMQKKTISLIALTYLMQGVLSGAGGQEVAKPKKDPYPAMAPLDQYLSPDQNSEIALARSAAPASISDSAEVMVLGRDGYITAVRGTNGFVCIVERSWGSATDAPDFWNPKLRAPHCFNAPAAKTFLPIFLLKTKLVLAGKSKAEIAPAVVAALDTKKLPALEPGAMCYMMSKQQYLGDRDKSWHPHLMFFAPGDAEKSWGANLPDSPIFAANDTEERVTIFMVVVGQWSDATPGPE